MSQRQLVLDTETTGLKVEEGHRIIEIACVEMLDRKLSGKQFHYYINPGRDIEAGALAVHGISNEFLHDKPIFNQIANEFIDFISGAELIIHNAPFDLSFINYELTLTKANWLTVTDYSQIVDTLPLARKLHPGQRNNLDALCKRYAIDTTKREWHGALLDAHLLAQVYLAMTGGQGSFFDSLDMSSQLINKQSPMTAAISPQKYTLTLLKANELELTAHQEYLQQLQKQGKCLWEELENNPIK